jgi:hypothetical protein
VAKLWDWATTNRLTVFLAVATGMLLGALVTGDLSGAAVALAVGAFLVVLSLAVNRWLDWWEARRGTST